jgi:hypothetical protein
MYTAQLDNISPDGEKHVAYVKILDGTETIANLCLPYDGDTTAFSVILEKKMQSIIEVRELKKTIESTVENVLGSLDTEKIVTKVTEVKS